MATAKRNYTSKRSHDTSRVYTTKTPFGSHAEMIVQDVSEFDICLKDNEVICKDDGGYYVTLKSRIDSGLADPNRYCSERIEKKETSND